MTTMRRPPPSRPTAYAEPDEVHGGRPAPAPSTRDGSASLVVVPLAGALGAEISGVDLATDLTDDVVAELRQIWLEHLVVFFRDQTLEPDEFLAFARRLGEPVEYPFIPGIDGYPEIISVTKLPHETVNFGGIWHSDTVYLDRPPMATMLIAREVPPSGGDTMWANMYAAYESLSSGMQRLLASLTAVNSSALADVSKTREDRIRDHGDGKDREYVAEHPVVRTHPETGEKVLFVNAFTTHFTNYHTPANVRFGQDANPGASMLLNYLISQAYIPEFQVRFRWKKNSMAMWDNRSTQHYAVMDYPPCHRKMERAGIIGDTPY